MTTDSRHACKKQIIVEFDENKSIIHFTSKDKLYINTPDKLSCINEKLTKSLEKYANKQKLYMIIDFNVFLIELDYANHIYPFLENLCKKYLHSNGIIGYGLSESRLTFKYNMKKLPHFQDHYFGTKDEAFNHVYMHLKDQHLDFEQESLKTTPIIIDTIEVIPSKDAPDRQYNS